MESRRRLPLLLLIAGWMMGAAGAGAQPARGIVWTPPDDVEAAEQTLVQMREAGIQAVRTGVIRNSRLLFAADTLGLQFYQDLPVERLSAAALLDTVGAARRVLDEALGRAQVHPSARHFGLARLSDTADTTACAYFRALAEHVRRRGPAGSRVYYGTPFATQDRCSGAVDFILLDALNADEPVERWRAAQGAASAPVGYGALGRWVRAGDAGLRASHSPEAQARYLEQNLALLLADTLASPPPVVFVHRWADVRRDVPSPGLDLREPTLRSYGLVDESGEPRPAYDVVAGLYTGRQGVFAFARGGPPPAGTPWLVLVGWGVFAVIGVFYALSPRFRHMVPRYFQAHNFYQAAIREGRDVLLGASSVLLVGLGASLGLVVSVLLDEVRTQPASDVFVQWMPEAVQQVSMTLLAQPWMMVLLLGSLYAFSMALWGGLLTLLSRRRHILSGGQSMMLVVFPRWPQLLVMVGAMVVPTLPDDLALPVALGLAGAWVLIVLYAVGRTLYDYYAVTRVPLRLCSLAVLFNPTVLLGVLVLIVVLQNRSELAFLYRLLAAQ